MYKIGFCLILSLQFPLLPLHFPLCHNFALLHHPCTLLSHHLAYFAMIMSYFVIIIQFGPNLFSIVPSLFSNVLLLLCHIDSNTSTYCYHCGIFCNNSIQLSHQRTLPCHYTVFFDFLVAFLYHHCVHHCVLFWQHRVIFCHYSFLLGPHSAISQ